MAKGWAAPAIGIVTALAVVLGLVLTGGPGHARKQQGDAQREQDLMSMAGWVDCLATAEGALPSTLSDLPQCDFRARLTDPYTQKPYRYEVTGQTSYRLCADFELPPQRPADRWGRNSDGCILREYQPGKDG